MANIRLSSSALLALALALPGFSACSRDAGSSSETAKRAEATSGEMSHRDKVDATIRAVDPSERTVTLEDDSKRPFTVLVSDDVDLDKLRPGQKVHVSYQESVAFALKDPKAAAASEPATTEQETRRRVPDGVQFGREIRTTVEIVSVEAGGSRATFRVPEGEIRTVGVTDPESQAKIANLRAGDAVEVTYTEKLAVAVAD